MKIIGRKYEIQKLEELYASQRPELIAVYGRRRVGKTFLINEVFKERLAFKHTGLSPELNQKDKSSLFKQQLNNFFMSLREYGSIHKKAPKDWFEAFEDLKELLKEKRHGQRLVVFLDELPWLDTPKSNFMMALEAFWNGWASSQEDLMMIICGSATAWITNKLINNHGGLYGRITYELSLKPFTLSECREYLMEKHINYSLYDMAQIYMALGGIPYYLNYLDNHLSIAQNIDRLFFSEDASLSHEYDRLFASVFNHPSQSKMIVEFLATKKMGYRRKEICAGTKIIDNGVFSQILSALIQSHFIVRYIPYTKSEREEYYKLIDPYCLFYLKFVKDKHYDEHFWLDNVNTPLINSWRGLAFEEVCFNHIGAIKQALGISGVSTCESSYQSQEDSTQIDLIIERKDNIIDICEIKFYNEEYNLDKDYYLKIQKRDNIIQSYSPKYSIHNVLITTFGIKNNEYSYVFNNVLILEDLFK